MSATLLEPPAARTQPPRPVAHLADPDKNPRRGICGARIEGIPAYGVWRLCERCDALRKAIERG